MYGFPVHAMVTHRLDNFKAIYFVMNEVPQNTARSSQKNKKNSLALKKSGVLEFRQYTQSVWSKVAGRPISEDEADQIIEDFGRFLRALAGDEKG